ncbi:MAG: DUF4855 domain-containing protein [Clostridia bacterium]|nr:DUF4855 domain-containing protein [Clostridia bacterium]
MKRFISFILAALLIAMSVPLLTYSQNRRLRGDANNDGSITPVDYAMVKRVYLRTYTPTEDQLIGCDANGDGKISPVDYAMVKRHVLRTYTITAYIDEPLEDTHYRTAVSLTKKYKLSKPASPTYPDTLNAELTDGVLAAESPSYTDNRFCGFNGKGSFTVTVDLENDSKRLNAFEISYLSVDTAGIYIPEAVGVSGSNNNSDFTPIGDFQLPPFSDLTVQKVVLDLEKEVEYRYIRFTVTSGSSWVFFDEVTVFANVASNSVIMAQSAPLQSYEKDKVSDTALAASRSAASSGKVYDPSLASVNIAKNKSYKIVTSNYDERAPYSETALTDGSDPEPSFECGEFVGISAANPSCIDIDLGDTEDDIYAFEISAFNRVTAKIHMPAYFDIRAGETESSLKHIGRAYAAVTGNDNFTYRVAVKDLVKAKIVRFVIPSKQSDAYYWFDEIKVFANRDNTYIPDYLYGDFSMQFTSETEYFSSADEDYNTEQNLIAGKTQEILSDIAVDRNKLPGYNTVYAESSKLLTDGEKDDTNMRYNGKWVQFGYGTGRRVFYDLGAICEVSSAALHILEYVDYSCGGIESLELSVSEDGVNWYSAGVSHPGREGALEIEDSYLYEARVEAAVPVRARYVALNIKMDDMRLFVGEIEVFGKKNAGNAADAAASGMEKVDQFTLIEKPGYLNPSPDILSGVKDVMLIYHNVGTVNFNSLLPYVAYIDKDGNVIDTMFDGYLFLPGTGKMPNGGYGEISSKKPDWDFLLSNMFDSGKGMDELERTAEYVKEQLGLNELELKVFVAIPRIDSRITDFGDVDGDGVSENLTVSEDRLKVGSTYIKQINDLFYAKNYKNLKLCGFYWFREDITGRDIEVTREITSEARKQGYPMFWIPYNEAEGFTRWKTFGFEAGCYQPNYAFDLEVEEFTLTEAAECAKMYNMCIELEMQENTITDKRFFVKYMNYLRHGVEDGYMEAIHMYYQSFGILARAARSLNHRARLAYDYTYRYVKRNLTTDFEADMTPLSFETAKESVLNGSVSAGGNAVGAVIFAPEITPQHGSLAMEDNGTFAYYPNAGFTGTDTFTFRVSRFLSYSEEITVTVKVR